MTRNEYTFDALDWSGSAWQSESTFHQLSPYIGKTKSSMAATLVDAFTKDRQVVYDPFSGCGTFAFEAWKAGRRVIASDLSPYANVLTRAKLYPYKTLDDAMCDLARIGRRVPDMMNQVDLRRVPLWVRAFFHRDTLRDLIAWVRLLQQERYWFLLACLLGILHHQRPGFLSYPSSHTVPYLRTKNFPRSRHPELYEYRPVRERLEAKVARAFRRVPKLDHRLLRKSFKKDAALFAPPVQVNAILTSPPYMRQLDYGRDNRLRLWFLGCKDWRELDNVISPGQENFLTLMRSCFVQWRSVLQPGGYCVLVVGDNCSREEKENLPREIAQIAKAGGGFQIAEQYVDEIPNDRRVRRGLCGNESETILVLRRG